MEQLSDFLQPFKDEIGLTASVVTILQFFSGGFICRDIYKVKSTRGFSTMPFTGGLVIGVLMLKLAFILQDQNMFNVNVAAIFLNALYLLFYTVYSSDIKQEVAIPTLKGSILTFSLLIYASYEDEDLLEYRYSLIVTCLMLLLMGSPLMELKTIVKNRDASFIPFPMVFMCFLVSVLWLLYGIILRNQFMIVQNFLGGTLCLVQLVLISFYPGAAHVVKKMD